MKKIYFLIVVFILSLNTSVFSQYNGVPKVTFDKIVAETALMLDGNSMKKGSRYMTQTKIEDKTDLESWEGHKLTQYTYTRQDSRRGTITAKVILYNPSSELLVKWVINALKKAEIKTSEKNIKIVIDFIDGQSNAQFPVRGLVYENLACNDGIWETYTFFDGVTVEVKDAQITTYKKNTCDFTSQTLDSDQIDKLLTMKADRVLEVKAKGRISSTDREEFKKAFRSVDVEGKRWVDVVRERYKNAMTNAENENDLIYATVFGKKGLEFGSKKIIVNGRQKTVPIIREFEQ